MVFMGKKKLTEGEIENYKMTEREIYEKFYNLSKEELNIKNNKNTFAKATSWQILLNIVEVRKKKEE